MQNFLANLDLLLDWLNANIGTLVYLATTIAAGVGGIYFAWRARSEAAAKRALMDGLDPQRNNNVAGAVVVEAQRAGVVHPADVAAITLDTLRQRAKSKRMGPIDREAKARKRAKDKG